MNTPTVPLTTANLARIGCASKHAAILEYVIGQSPTTASGILSRRIHRRNLCRNRATVDVDSGPHHTLTDEQPVLDAPPQRTERADRILTRARTFKALSPPSPPLQPLRRPEAVDTSSPRMNAHKKQARGGPPTANTKDLGATQFIEAALNRKKSAAAPPRAGVREKKRRKLAKGRMTLDTACHSGVFNKGAASHACRIPAAFSELDFLQGERRDANASSGPHLGAQAHSQVEASSHGGREAYDDHIRRQQSRPASTGPRDSVVPTKRSHAATRTYRGRSHRLHSRSRLAAECTSHTNEHMSGDTVDGPHQHADLTLLQPRDIDGMSQSEGRAGSVKSAQSQIIESAVQDDKLGSGITCSSSGPTRPGTQSAALGLQHESPALRAHLMGLLSQKLGDVRDPLPTEEQGDQRSVSRDEEGRTCMPADDHDVGAESRTPSSRKGHSSHLSTEIPVLGDYAGQTMAPADSTHSDGVAIAMAPDEAPDAVDPSNTGQTEIVIFGQTATSDVLIPLRAPSTQSSSGGESPSRQSPSNQAPISPQRSVSCPSPEPESHGGEATRTQEAFTSFPAESSQDEIDFLLPRKHTRASLHSSIDKLGLVRGISDARSTQSSHDPLDLISRPRQMGRTRLSSRCHSGRPSSEDRPQRTVLQDLEDAQRRAVEHVLNTTPAWMKDRKRSYASCEDAASGRAVSTKQSTTGASTARVEDRDDQGNKYDSRLPKGFQAASPTPQDRQTPGSPDDACSVGVADQLAREQDWQACFSNPQAIPPLR
ncbi:unnamed protein product [Parajaminaea phylloscopi]